MNGLVLEGGAMRGLFTAGVLDVLMENDIAFDGAVGVSAGAVFGCNIKSGQIGRVIRYNKRFSRDPRYSGLRSLLRTGNLYNEEFCYHTVPERLDPFDTAAFRNNPMEFLVAATEIVSGKPVYALCERGDSEDIEWMRASASMPLVSRPVLIGNKRLLDGGIADSIPIRFMERRGYEHNVVVLTRPESYRKKRSALMPLIRIVMRKYPALIETMENRHIRYNETLEYIRTREKTGDVFVIRPEEQLEIGRTENDPQVMERVYRNGRETAERRLNDLKAFMQI